jgi:hypothetical protein
MKAFIFIIVFLATFVGIIYGAWYLKRTVNYKLFYQDNVIEEIHKQVKRECLNEL